MASVTPRIRVPDPYLRTLGDAAVALAAGGPPDKLLGRRLVVPTIKVSAGVDAGNVAAVLAAPGSRARARRAVATTRNEAHPTDTGKDQS